MVLKWTIDEVGEDDMTEGSQVKEVGEDNMPEGSQVKYELITGVSGNDPKMLCPSLAIERYQPKQ